MVYQAQIIQFVSQKPVSQFEVKHKLLKLTYLEINSIIYRISSHGSWRLILPLSIDRLLLPLISFPLLLLLLIVRLLALDIANNDNNNNNN
jgi:hypothetical protein